MARLTLDQINQMTPDMNGYLQALGYSVGGEADDGSMRYVDSEGNWVSPDNAQELFSEEALQGYAADQRRMKGIIDLADYSNPGSIAEYAKKGWNSPEAYLSQLYGGGEKVGDYFVLPEEKDVRSAQMVGTPIVYNSPGLFKEFITNAALLAGAGYGLNALTTGGFGGFGAGADAAWGVNQAGTGAGAFGGDIAGTAFATEGGLGAAGAGAGAAGATATELGTALAGAGDWAALDALAGVPAGATYGAEAAGGLFSGLGDFVSSLLPTGQDNPFTLGNLGSAAANYFFNQQAAGDYKDAANQAFQQGNPLNDPRRQPYQQQLAQLLSNPTEFYNTNPVVKAQMDLARRQFEANSAKMGVGGTQFADYLKNVQNNAASTFNSQAELLSGLGGFGFPGGGGVSAGTQANMAGAKQASQGAQGIGQLMDLFKQSSMGQKDIFDAAKNIFSLG